MLEGFKPVQLVSGRSFLSVTNNGLGFNKNIVIKMNKPRYVRFMIDDESLRLAIQAVTEKDDSTIKFYSEDMNINNGVRYHNRDLEHTIEMLMQWDLSLYNYRIDGYYVVEEAAMLFNLKEARTFPKRNRAK